MLKYKISISKIDLGGYVLCFVHELLYTHAECINSGGIAGGVLGAIICLSVSIIVVAIVVVFVVALVARQNHDKDKSMYVT